MRSIQIFGGHVLAILFGLLSCVGLAPGDEPTGAPSVFVVLVDVSGSMDDPFPAPVQTKLKDTTKLHDVRRRLELLSQHLPVRTRVIAYTFDHRLIKIFDGTIYSDEERSRLAEAFARLRTDNGSTFLWRSLDTGLSQAQGLLAEQDHTRARVLVYSDGKDEERNSQLDQNVIVARYSQLLREHVQVDFLTVGYDLAAEVQQPLEAAGVRFTSADVPQKLDVAVAGFTLSHDEVELDQPVTLINQSYGTTLTSTEVDWGDGTKKESVRDQARHVYVKPGTFKITLNAVSGQARDGVSRNLQVKPSPPQMAFRLTVDAAKVGDKIVAINETADSQNLSFQWLANGEVISRDRHLEWIPTIAAEYQIELRASDAWQQSGRETKTLAVAAKPKTVVEIADPGAIAAGQTVTFTHTANGPITSTRWRVNGELVSENAAASWRAVPGQHELLLEFSSDGQRDRVTRKLSVLAPPKPKATFTASAQKTNPNVPVVLINESSATAVRFQWYVNGQLLSEDRHWTWTPSEVGKYQLRLGAADEWGQVDETEMTIEVEAWAKPIVSIVAPAALQPKTRLTAVCNVIGEVQAVAWTLNGQAIESNGFQVDLEDLPPGKYDLQINADSLGGSVSAAHTFEVLPFAPPVAGFAVSNDRPSVGDVIKLIDRSTGPVDSVRFFVRAGNAGVVELASADSESLEYLCDTVGGLTIEQHVTGPGGSSEERLELTVASKLVPPVARFETDEIWHRGCLELVIWNRCNGDVAVLEFDPGDGSPVRRMNPTDKITHKYLPGDYRAQIIARSDEPTVAPSVWTSPRYQVSAPWPVWVFHLLWVIPAAFFVAVVGWLTLQAYRDESAASVGVMLTGTLSVSPTGRPWESQAHAFSGKTTEEILELTPNTRLRVTCITGDEIALELQVDGTSEAAVNCRGGQGCSIGEFEISYSPDALL